MNAKAKAAGVTWSEFLKSRSIPAELAIAKFRYSSKVGAAEGAVDVLDWLTRRKDKNICETASAFKERVKEISCSNLLPVSWLSHAPLFMGTCHVVYRIASGSIGWRDWKGVAIALFGMIVAQGYLQFTVSA